MKPRVYVAGRWSDANAGEDHTDATNAILMALKLAASRTAVRP